MHIHQDGINSVIGRIGLGIGKETERSNLFAKIALAHEFRRKSEEHLQCGKRTDEWDRSRPERQLGRRRSRRKLAGEQEHLSVRNLHEKLRG